MLECERNRSTIHLLLTDVVLTHMNGRELAQKLLPMRPEMKVLFMSGYSEEAIAQHGVLNPGTEFLQKPFTTESADPQSPRDAGRTTARSSRQQLTVRFS